MIAAAAIAMPATAPPLSLDEDDFDGVAPPLLDDEFEELTWLSVV